MAKIIFEEPGGHEHLAALRVEVEHRGRVRGEEEAVIDRPQLAPIAQQKMLRFAVGIVEQNVEQRKLA